MNYDLELPVWQREDLSTIACTEKIKVMRQNIEELQQMMQDAYEDALLMEVNPLQVQQVLHTLVDNLINPYSKK
ncbi:MAG: hypothetical protein RLZZ293_344 [Pseudomonadota bacterium]|jgi:hypothetical protein